MGNHVVPPAAASSMPVPSGSPRLAPGTGQ